MTDENKNPKKVSKNTGKEAGRIEKAKEYQQRIEGDVGASALQKAKIKIRSFKTYSVPLLFLYVFFPIVLLFINAVIFHYDINMKATPPGWAETSANIVQLYTQTVLLGFIPQFFYFIVSSVSGVGTSYPDFWINLVQTNFVSGESSILIAISIYALTHILISWFVWMITARVFFGASLWSDPLTIGEKHKNKLEKSDGTSKQSSSSASDISKAKSKRHDVKTLIAEVEDTKPKNLATKIITAIRSIFGKRSTHTMYARYKLNFLEPYRWFFNHFDSVRANMLASKTQKRWEKIKEAKQKVNSDDKFFLALYSGYQKMGNDPVSNIKASIIEDMPFTFKTSKGKIFNNPKEIFAKSGDKKTLKRNLFVLLSATQLLKNQMLVPTFKFLKEKHGIEFNKSEKRFITYGRQIFTSVDFGKLERFDNYTTYKLPRSLQYDYPYFEDQDLTYQVAKSINDFDTMQRVVAGNVREFHALLPKYNPNEDFSLYQRQLDDFTFRFVKNLENIRQSIHDYILSRMLINPTLKDYDKAVLSTHIKNIIEQDVINTVVQFGGTPSFDLEDEDSNMSMFEDREYRKIPVKKLMFNEASPDGIPQMILPAESPIDLSSYSAFRRPMEALSLPRVNYMIDRIYERANHSTKIRSIIDVCMTDFELYESFGNISAFLHIKEKELIQLKRPSSAI